MTPISPFSNLPNLLPNGTIPQSTTPLIIPKQDKDTPTKQLPLPPNMITPTKKEKEFIKSDDFEEFVIKDKHLGEVPVITYTFGEEPNSSQWIINLLWPTDRKIFN